jgi:hypothetical protein
VPALVRSHGDQRSSTRSQVTPGYASDTLQAALEHPGKQSGINSANMIVSPPIFLVKGDVRELLGHDRTCPPPSRGDTRGSKAVDVGIRHVGFRAASETPSPRAWRFQDGGSMRTSDRGQLTATRPTGRRSSAKLERAYLRREIEPDPGDGGRMTGVLRRSSSGLF